MANALLIGVRFLAGAMIGVALVRITGTDRHPWLIAIVGLAPLLLVPAWGVASFAWVEKRRLLLAVALFLIASQLRWFALEGNWRAAVNDEPAVVLATGNLSLHNETPVAFVESMIDAEADVILLQELSGSHWRAIAEIEGLTDYPYRMIDPSETGLGSAILSRLPTHDAGVDDYEYGRSTWAAVEWPNGRQVEIVNVHLTSPRDSLSISRWKAEHRRLAARVEESASPMVLAGDFNSTVQHDEFRELLDVGLVDAHAAVGGGLGYTWGVLGIDLMRLDHVLVGADLGLLSTRPVRGPGSDHRILTVDMGD